MRRRRKAPSRPKVSVRKTATVSTSKGDRVVVENYSPTGNGRTRTRFVGTAKTAAARRTSQTGGRSTAADKKKIAGAPGKRVRYDSTGRVKTYYEYRRNRSDADKRRRI